MTKHLSLADALAIVRTTPFNQAASVLEQMLTPAVRLHVSQNGAATLPRGASRFGGLPDVPPGFSWPTDASGAPLAFLAQIDLNACMGVHPDLEAWRSGWLYAFYDDRSQPRGAAADHGSWRLIRADAAGNALVPAEPPAGLAVRGRRSVTISPQAVWTLPSWGLMVPELAEALNIAHIPYEQLNPAAIQAWEKLRLALIDAAEDEDAPRHLLGGWPDEVENFLPFALQTVLAPPDESFESDDDEDDDVEDPGAALPESLRERLIDANNWVLMLQLDTDDEVGWRWAEDGRLYFLIHRDELIAETTDDAWAVIQSY